MKRKCKVGLFFASAALLACCPPKDPQVVKALHDKQRQACQEFCNVAMACVVEFRPTAAPIAPLCECGRCVDQ